MSSYKNNGIALIDEFSAAFDDEQYDSALVRMANAKWQSELIGAISETTASKPINVEQLTKQYESLTTDLLNALDQDTADPRVRNTARQALIRPATREIMDKGTLDGDWLPQYADTIANMPLMVQMSGDQVSAQTSMGMTLTNHFSELLDATNDFAFLRPPEQVAQWAHEHISEHASNAARAIAPHEERGVAYQNQLNAHRKLFLSAYRKEANEWKSLFEQAPETASLYAEGAPLSGVESRFEQQAQSLKAMVTPSAKQTLGIER